MKQPKCNDTQFLGVRSKVATYIASKEFTAARKALEAETDPTKQRGIVICTGVLLFPPTCCRQRCCLCC